MPGKLGRRVREIAAFLAIALVVSLVVDYLRRPALPETFISQPLQTIDGQTVDLAAMSQQRPLLIYVWATWCGICRMTTPSVISLAADGGNVVTVAMRSGDDASLASWMERKRMTLPTVNDPGGGLARQWGVQVTPTLVIVSKGRVASVTSGWTSGWGIRLRLWLAS